MTVAGLLLVIPTLFAVQSACADDSQPQPATPDAASGLPGMVVFGASDAQPMGMDEPQVKKALQAMGHPLDTSDRSRFLWDYGFTFMTPRHTVTVGQFALSRYELTNAQWAVFLDADVNQTTVDTQADETLKMLVKRLYTFDAETNPVDAQRAGLFLFQRNADALGTALNPDADPKWEPLKAWVEDALLPAGTTLKANFILPPPFWPKGELPEGERDRPVSGLSWSDARKFCHWAGLHVPLEAEWARAARGDEGRTYPWGNEWKPEAVVCKGWPGFEGEPTPQDVNSLTEFATPEGIHHMLGNISEYVFDIARKYDGSKTKFKYHNAGMLARGGSYQDEPYVMLAADRIWDMGSSQIGPDSRAETFGFRTASYPLPGADLSLELATFGAEFDRTRGAAHWLPHPPGLSERDRSNRAKREALLGFAHARTAGWIERQIDASAAHNAFVTGAAKGIAFLPIKGISDKYMKASETLTKLANDKDETAFVGALVSTRKCKLALQNEAGQPITFDMGDINSAAWADHDLAFFYQVGLWLVLKGDRVAVYGGNGSDAGIHGAHLRGKPLGYLPLGWSEVWGNTADAKPRSTVTDGAITLSTALPQLDNNGAVKRNGKATTLTIQVSATFE